MEAIVNWIWQGLALTALTTLTLHRSPRLSATTRYLVWWLTLVLVLLLPVAPRFAGWMQPAAAPSGVTALAPMPLPALPWWPLTAVVVGWMAWVVVSLVRVMTSVTALIAARRRVRPFPATRELALPHWTAVRTHGRPARLAMCDRIPAAAVFGLGPAIIALSPDICARLSDEELDQVILHEWAHVQRRDDFSRLAQIAVRVIAGLHPAVWWIGRKLEIERETACDDFAVNVTGAARSLARCLTKLAEARPPRMPVVLAPGVLASSQLATRVQRLLDPSRNTSTARARGVMGPIAAALVALAAGLSQVELVGAAAPIEPPAETRTSAAVLGPGPLASDPPRVPSKAAAPASGPSAVPSSTAGATVAPPQPPGSGLEVAAPAGMASEVIDATPLASLPRAPWAAPELPAVVGEGTSNTADDAVAGSAQTPWGAAASAGAALGRGSQKAGGATADAGVSIGHSSTKAAVATAGFFSRLGRKVGGSF